MQRSIVSDARPSSRYLVIASLAFFSTSFGVA
jgi:hypothetical protein